MNQIENAIGKYVEYNWEYNMACYFWVQNKTTNDSAAFDWLNAVIEWRARKASHKQVIKMSHRQLKLCRGPCIPPI